MALSPPNASSAGLRARHAAKSDTAASTLIQAIVTVCTVGFAGQRLETLFAAPKPFTTLWHCTRTLRLQWIPPLLKLGRIMSSLGGHPRACTSVQQINKLIADTFLCIGYPLEGI
jgi:hypothetical protein